MGTFPPTEVEYLYSSLLSQVTPTGYSRKFYLFLLCSINRFYESSILILNVLSGSIQFSSISGLIYLLIR